MKLTKTMLVVALIAGSLFVCSTAVLAQADAPAGGAAAPGGAGGGARGPMTSDGLIKRFQSSLGETNKLTDDEITKVKPVLDDMIKKQADLRADTTIAQADKRTKRAAITTEASDALKAIVTADQFKVIQPLLQRGGGRRGGGNGGGTPPPAAPPQT
jgi:hypothetical protein